MMLVISALINSPVLSEWVSESPWASF